VNPKPNRASQDRAASEEADGAELTGDHDEATAAAPEPTPAAGRRPDAVRVRGVHKSFGRTSVLRGVDLDVPAGGITAVLGPSGSGKTTLLRILAGFEQADAGTVRLGGALMDGSPDDEPADDDGATAAFGRDAESGHRHRRRGRSVPPERRRIGYVPQDGALFPHLTVAHNIGFALGRSLLRRSMPGRSMPGGDQRRDRSRAQQRDRIEQLLELTDLVGLGHRYPHELSGGQQQRAALARALAHGPAVVLLDEPFSALDAALRATVREQVIGVLRATGTAGVLVTHDQDEALSTADRVAVLRDGVVAQHGPAQELYDSPADAMEAGFLGEANLVAGELHSDGTVQAGPFGAVPLRALSSKTSTATGGPVSNGGAATVLVRPEQLKVVTVDAAGAVRAVIERREYFGHDAVLTVRPEGCAGGGALPEKLRVRVADESASDPQLSPGSVISLSVGGPVTAWSAITD
jgi:iron(III) transport system ATP-binding protein